MEYPYRSISLKSTALPSSLSHFPSAFCGISTLQLHIVTPLIPHRTFCFIPYQGFNSVITSLFVLANSLKSRNPSSYVNWHGPVAQTGQVTLLISKRASLTNRSRYKSSISNSCSLPQLSHIHFIFPLLYVVVGGATLLVSGLCSFIACCHPILPASYRGNLYSLFVLHTVPIRVAGTCWLGKPSRV